MIIKLTKTLKNTDAESLLQVYNTALHKAYKSFGLTPFRQKWIDEENPSESGAFSNLSRLCSYNYESFSWIKFCS